MEHFSFIDTIIVQKFIQSSQVELKPKFDCSGFHFIHSFGHTIDSHSLNSLCVCAYVYQNQTKPKRTESEKLVLFGFYFGSVWFGLVLLSVFKLDFLLQNSVHFLLPTWWSHTKAIMPVKLPMEQAKAGNYFKA